MTYQWYVNDDQTQIAVINADTGDVIESATAKIWASVIPASVADGADLPIPERFDMAILHKMIFHLFNDPVSFQKYRDVLKLARQYGAKRAMTFVTWPMDFEL